MRLGETQSALEELHGTFTAITHTSVYLLEDEKYPSHWKYLCLTGSEMQREFESIIDYFDELGWNHYELSNWAKPGYESIHNRGYWDHSTVRGFGLSASSYVDGIRFTNASSFQAYYRGERIMEENLTPEQIEIEKMMF